MLGRQRTTTVLAWSLFAIFLSIALAVFALLAAGRGGDDFFLLLAVGYPFVGALVASRQPSNPVGWLLLVVGIGVALSVLVDTNVRSETAPAFAASAWLSDWGFFVWLALAAIFLPLLFPDGRLVSRRWRPVLWLGVVAMMAMVIGAAFEPGPLDVDSPRQVDNPLGIEAAAGLLSVVSTVGDLLLAVSFLLAAASVVVRFRRSRGSERQQLKWFAYVGMIAAAGLSLLMAYVVFVNQEGKDEVAGWVGVLGVLGWFTALLTVLIGLPVATGIAILRHRLYDIDVIIRRTLVYGALTATLAGAYVGSVLLFQLVLSPDSDFAIAGSTLAVAALFRPASSRIQALVDHRFYRRKYDAAQTIEAFGSRLRNEVELDALSAELGGVVRETMQPAHLSLWLRGEAR